MLDKVRSSQTEILMINKNLASNLKKQRAELTDLQTKSSLNQTIIESILVQNLALEQTIQALLDDQGGPRQDTNLSVKAKRLTALSIVASNAIESNHLPSNSSVMSASTLH